MNIEIRVTDENGETWVGSLHLRRSGSPRSAQNGDAGSSQPELAKADPVSIDFSLPPRAFVKKYAQRSFSGAQRFTLLLAAMTKGEVDQVRDISTIRKTWSKMTEPLGAKFNSAHATRAKDAGWVISPVQGQYRLLPGWHGIFETTK